MNMYDDIHDLQEEVETLRDRLDATETAFHKDMNYAYDAFVRLRKHVDETNKQTKEILRDEVRRVSSALWTELSDIRGIRPFEPNPEFLMRKPPKHLKIVIPSKDFPGQTYVSCDNCKWSVWTWAERDANTRFEEHVELVDLRAKNERGEIS